MLFRKHLLSWTVLEREQWHSDIWWKVCMG